MKPTGSLAHPFWWGLESVRCANTVGARTRRRDGVTSARWEVLVCPGEPGDHRGLLVTSSLYLAEWLTDLLQTAGVDAWVEDAD